MCQSYAPPLNSLKPACLRKVNLEGPRLRRGRGGLRPEGEKIIGLDRSVIICLPINLRLLPLYVFLCTFFLIKKYQKIKAGLCFSALCPIPDCRQAGMHFINKPSKLPCVKCNGLAIHAIPLRASQPGRRA
jgi:hypothetical protein